MSEHDESLEIGIAAGLDVPTALVISEEPEGPDGDGGPEKRGGCLRLIVCVVVGLLAAGLCGLLFR